MMKRIPMFFILYCSFFIGLPFYAADAVRAKLGQARESLQKKLGTIQLRQTLSRNANCLLRNICEPGQKEYLTSLAKKLGISVAVLATLAAAGGVAVAAKVTTQEEKPIAIITQQEAKSLPSIEKLAAQFGITSIPQDDSPPSRFIHAIRNKVPKVVASLTDLVSEQFLKLGQAIAQMSQQITRDIKEQQTYKAIESIINQALAAYDDSVLHKNLQFIYAVTTGLFDEVKARMCDAWLMPTKNAIQEAIAQISARAQGNYVIQEIITFIKNPRCKGGSS